ncbi:MAG TPA: NADH-quinone oxidoreductase subunit J [Conexibacter sp.]|jgi:NADH:ubiquinone oxidoreductase subunit 6 (subunit J)|nr:NADH-quinone oxidoreductase subunit J [Conexibacter sp.]
MSAVVFFIAAIGAIAGAIGVVALRNPFYSVLALVGHLLSLAALFLLLRAEFIAAAQVVVYAGAVMVLYLFVVSYIGGGAHQLTPGGSNLRLVAGGAVLALFAELAIAVLGSGLKAIDSDGAPYVSGFGSPAAIGESLLTKFLFPFEVASLLLLVAAVGAVVLARRRKGTTLDDAERDAAHYITPRSLFSGTMAEAVGAIRDPAEPPVGVTDENERSGW